MYVFLDTETTGLDPETCVILEVGIYVCSDEFEPIDKFIQQVHYNPFINGKIRPEFEDDDGEFVFKMHEKNRLWQACQNSYLNNKAVENMAIDFLEKNEYNHQPMCGSTIDFDRRFLIKHMPHLNSVFHYRSINVSSFRETFVRYGIDPPPKREAHRALADAKESADQLKYYLTRLGFHDA